jgi:peptidase M28-like protein/PA domain-containing protein
MGSRSRFSKPRAGAFWILVLLALAVAACSGKSKSPDQQATSLPTAGDTPGAGPSSLRPAEIALRFDEQKAMDLVRTLSETRFMGRHTGTPGEELGATLLADQFKADGLKPAGDNGTFLQGFPVTVTEMTAPPLLALADSAGRERSLQLRDDYRPLIGGTAGPGDIQGDGFFAGTGDLSGQDVKGKVLLVVARRPIADILRDAKSAGAAGVLFTTGSQLLLKGEAHEFGESVIPAALVSAQGAVALFDGSGHSREELNADLQGGVPVPTFPLVFHIHLSVQASSKTVQAHNVIALLPATAPTQVTFIVGGHYEEIGPDPDGVVFPAANDNASGAAVVLEMARLLSAEHVQSKANILFIGWSGHEEGLLGSMYYVDHPAFPLADTRLYINLDTVGQGKGDSLFAGFSTQDMTDTVQNAVSQIKAAGAANIKVQVNRETRGASDHETFQRRGVADIDFNWTEIFGGPIQIHTPPDDASNVDPAKLKTTGEVATASLLLAVAGAP